MSPLSSQPGVHVGRRTVLKGSAAAALSFALGRFAFADTQTGRVADRSAEPFFKDWTALADRLFDEEGMSEERYIRELTGLVSQLPLNAVPPRRKVVFDKNGLKTGPAWSEGRIFVVELTLQPHAVIRPHNHPSHNAVSLGLAGSCQYEHYEIVGEAPPAKSGTPSALPRIAPSGHSCGPHAISPPT